MQIWAVTLFLSDDAHWLTSLLCPFACSFVLYITSPRTPSLDSSREYTLFYCIFYVEDLTILVYSGRAAVCTPSSNLTAFVKVEP
jgi:hypothetical protein